MMYKHIMLALTLLVIACAPAGPKAVVYKDPNCGCCEGYAKALAQEGFDVEVVKTDMDMIHSRFDIPMDMRSCHLVEVDDYIVEGHVPMSAVHRMLDERPDIRGIALPNMPSGTPGMPGPKRAPYVIYSLTDNQSQRYMVI